MEITSTKNPLVKECRRLKETKWRRENGKFLAEGPHLIKELFDSSLQIEQILISADKLRNDSRALCQEASKLRIPITEMSDEVFRTLCETENPQGILAIAIKTETKLSIKVDSNRFVVLIGDRIQDPGNLGSLIRTAWGFGVNLSIFTPGTVDIYNPKVLRTSMGGVFHLPSVCASYDEIISWASTNEVSLFAGKVDAEEVLFKTVFPEKIGFVVGNEGAGISSEWEKANNIKYVRIPMPGKAESLNVSMAAGIMMYENIRQYI